MSRLRDFLMPVAIVLGIMFPSAHALSFLMPWLIALMMFLSFVGPVNATAKGATRRVAVRVLLASLAFALLLSVLGCLGNWSVPMLLAGVLLCLAPPANAAPAMARVLGGNPLLMLKLVVGGHLVATLVLPLLAALYHDSAGHAGTGIALQVFRSIALLVGSPILLAFVLKWRFPHTAAICAKATPYVMFLWSFMVFVVLANASYNVRELLASGQFDWPGLLQVGLLSLLLAVALFFTGWKLGGKQYAVETSQGLGQKNTVLAIWVAQAYFHPVAALGPVFYVVWQNLILSYLSRKVRR